MKVAGVEVSPSQAAQLALLLERAQSPRLAQRLGIAVDTGSAGINLNADEKRTVLNVLISSPDSLVALRTALSDGGPTTR